MIINKSLNLKLATFSIIIFFTTSCNTTTTKIENNRPDKQVQPKKIASISSSEVSKLITRKPVQSAIKSNITPTTTEDAIPAWRRPASHTLTRGSKDSIFPAAKDGDLTTLKELLAEGTDVDHRNFNGETVLHVAASRGNLEMVKYLVSKGADVNAMTGKQWQPIHHAMRFEHPQVANYLISKKVSVLAKTSDGLTALELAKASKKSAIQAIIKKYAPQ